MKKLLLVVFSFSTLLTFSQKNFSLVQEDHSGMVVEIKDKPIALLSQVVENGIQYIDFSKTHKIVTLEKGKPQLPVYSKSIVIPAKGNASIEITYLDVEEFENLNVLPSKGNLKRNIDPATVPYEFGSVYSENKFFPENPESLEEPYNLRTIRGQVIRFYPYQYNPVTKTLKHFKTVQIRIKYNEETPGINELASSDIDPNDALSYKSFFLNEPKTEKYNQLLEAGDLLILTPASYLDSLQALIQWKIEKGIGTKIITTAESGETAVNVKSLIQAEYALNPNLKYVLLVGDHQQIPAYSYGTSSDGEALSSDSYFGQLVGTDFYPEVFVGRFSGTTTNVANMVRKTIEYETNPVAGDWMTKALGLGSGQGAGYGDDDQADWQHLRGIRTQLLDYGYTGVYEFYEGTRGQEDATGNPTSGIILPVVNEGIGLFNYTGHGDINTCITGNFGSTQINQGTNNGKYPFVISVACNNGTFTLGNCISESWLKAVKNGSPTGAIAACGSSILMAWAPPMQTQDGMTDLIVKSDQNNIKNTLGGLFYNGQLSMLEDYPSEGREVMQTWVFFGDPSVDFRNKTTQDLAVVYDTCITKATSQSITFTSAENDVLVSLTQNGTALAKGTVQNGTLTLNLTSFDVNQDVKVTCSKPNFRVQSGTLSSSGTCNPNQSPTGNPFVFPSPSSGKISLDLGKTVSSLKYSIYDVTGKIVMHYENASFNSNLAEDIDIKTLANGVYTISVESGSEEFQLKFVVQQ